MGRLIIDGNKVYELDEQCIREKRIISQQSKEKEKKQTGDMQMHNKKKQ